MNIDTFVEEMVISQTDGVLTDYVLDNWDEALGMMPHANLDMDTLIELASDVGLSRNTESLEKIYSFIEKWKAVQK